MCTACVVAQVRTPGPAPAGPFPTSFNGKIFADDVPRADRAEGAAEAGSLEPIEGTLTWTGVAGFLLDTGGVRIAFDPYVSRPGVSATLFSRPRPDFAAVAGAFPRLDAVFVNHTHFDHALDLPAVAAASPGAVIHGSRTTIELCRRSGVPSSALRVVADGERIAVGPVTIEAVASRHGLVPVAHRVDRVDLPRRGLPRTPFRYPRGDVFAYRIEVGGRSIHLQGSAGIDDAALARQQPVDLLIACLAARQGTPGYLDRLAERLRPGLVAPCHHDNFFVPLSAPPRPVAQLDWPAFLDDAARLRARYGTGVVAFPRGVPVPL